MTKNISTKPLSEKITAETQSLILEAQKGNRKAMNLVLNQYEDLVRDEANKLLCFGVDFDDLCQEGRIGLCNAIRKYDFEQKVWFFSYAKNTIRFAILDYINRYGDLVSIPVNKKKEMVRQSKENEEDSFLPAYRSLSAPAFFGDDDAEAYESRLSADNAEWWQVEENGADAQLMKEDEHQQLMEVCQRTLSLREQEVVELFCQEFTTAEIAQKMNLSTTRINQILAAARTKLSAYATAA